MSRIRHAALSLSRSEPAKKSGQNIPKNRCRTTIAERMVETRAELPFIGDQVVCLSHDQAARRRPRVCGLGTISAGDSVHRDGRYVTVPKMRLLTGLLSICYRAELEISKRLRDYVEFRRQLQNIGTMATDSGTGETWRARRGHDELVIAVSMAVWYLENPGPNMGLLDLRAGGAWLRQCPGPVRHLTAGGGSRSRFWWPLHTARPLSA